MNNIVLQLQKNNDTSILNNNSIIFDETINIMGDISYNNVTGVVTISENGIYIIDWCVSPQSTSSSSPSVIFKLISDKGDEFDSNSPIRPGSMSGIAVLEVDDAPINFSLVNVSNATVFFQNTVISKANLRVFNLGSSNITDNSRCFALDQFANLLEQVVDIYHGASVSVFSNRLATISGTIDSLYKSADAGNVPMLILESGGDPVVFNIDKIAILYLPNSVYDDSITYLTPPNPFPQNCDTDLLKNVHDYISVGYTISVTTGPTTSASGDVYVNEYGIIVLADETSTIFLWVPQIFTITVDADPNLRSEKKSSSISITDEDTKKE